MQITPKPVDSPSLNYKICEFWAIVKKYIMLSCILIFFKNMVSGIIIHGTIA
jgi:hypothetical protein